MQWYRVECIIKGSKLQRRNWAGERVGVLGSSAAGGGGGEGGAEKNEDGGAAAGRDNAVGVEERRPSIGLRRRREYGEWLQPLVPRRRAWYMEWAALCDSCHQRKIKNLIFYFLIIFIFIFIFFDFHLLRVEPYEENVLKGPTRHGSIVKWSRYLVFVPKEKKKFHIGPAIQSFSKNIAHLVLVYLIFHFFQLRSFLVSFCSLVKYNMLTMLDEHVSCMCLLLFIFDEFCTAVPNVQLYFLLK